MLVLKVDNKNNPALNDHPVLAAISPDELYKTVQSLAYPRHYIENRRANEQARDWISARLTDYGYQVAHQGRFANIIATPQHLAAHEYNEYILLGAHYDTVPTTPGADDNSSAIAVCLEAARALAKHAPCPLMIAIFNREEDGLLGSAEFVQHLATRNDVRITEVHIFEMVGYFDKTANSQRKPLNLPIPLPATGDFIGIISNSHSNHITTDILHTAKRIGSTTPVIALKTFFGIEKYFVDLLRSDHAPFWAAGLPALMWTDTSNFRNPNYHLPSDTPETLDYHSMAEVCKIITAHILARYQP